MSEIYKEIIWECPKCKNKNTDTYLDIETHPVKCINCKITFDIYVKAKLDIEILKISDGSCDEEEKQRFFERLNHSKYIEMKGGVKMKFYKFDNKEYSYYALIGSSNEEKAKEFYEENIANIEGSEKDSKPIELSPKEAFEEIIRYYNVKEKDSSDTKKRFNKAIAEGENTLLAIDKCLN